MFNFIHFVLQLPSQDQKISCEIKTSEIHSNFFFFFKTFSLAPTRILNLRDNKFTSVNAIESIPIDQNFDSIMKSIEALKNLKINHIRIYHNMLKYEIFMIRAEMRQTLNFEWHKTAKKCQKRSKASKV